LITIFTPIELDKTRNFRYGMKAISFVEKKLKKNISKINLDDLSMEDTAVIVLAGLVHEDNKLTADKVMDLIDNHSNLPTVMEAMNKAFDDAFGGNEQEKN
jgi:hypothetical protein